MGPRARPGALGTALAAILPLVAALAAAAPPAEAGTVLVTATRELAEPGEPPRTGRALLDGRRLRIDTREGERSIVYRGDRGLVWLIDHAKARYVEIDRPTPEMVAGEARRRLEELPPDERAAARQALEDAKAAGDPAAGGAADGLRGLALRETGESDRVEGIPCRELAVLREGARIAELCRADYAEAGVSPESFAAVREVQALLRDSAAALLAGESGDPGLAALASFGDLEGVPLRVRVFEQGEPTSETRVTGIESRPLDAADFEIPEGYRPRVTIRIRGEGGGDAAGAP